MRYYSIKIGGDNPPANFPAQQGALISGATWSSQINGKNDPGALNVEFDIITAPFATPAGGSFLRVWGVSLQQIAQSSQLNQKPIEVYAGMATGLPLANAAQQGLIAKGTIWPAFGNWVGTDQTLDLILQAPFTGSTGTQTPDTPSNPAPIVHSWKSGTSLSDAIKKTLSTAFPDFTPQINISSDLKVNYDDTGFYPTIEAYAGYIRQISQSIMGAGKYPGVFIAVQGKNFIVSDGTQNSDNTKEIKFQDMIGQPTWLGLNVISVKVIMRGDINIADKIKLPQTLSVASAASSPQFRQNSVFQGTFFVKQVRHLGNFRQADGASWVTVLDCASTGTSEG